MHADYPELGGSAGSVATRLVTSGKPPVPSGAALAPSEPLPPGGPGPPLRGLAVPREPPSIGRLVLRQLGWASMPLWSIGLLAFGPFVWLAITRRRRWDRAVATAYVAACAAAVGLVSLSPSVSSYGNAAGGLLFGLAVVGAGHALVACRPGRRDASGRPVISKAYGNVLAESRAGERMDVRNKARKLARKDPALARELRIGRPDLPREYDDGGLVDVNHVPAAVLVSHLNLTAEQAAKVVSVRDQIARFDGPADLEAYADLPPERVDELSGLMMFG